MTLRYPEVSKECTSNVIMLLTETFCKTPTQDERDALESYFYLSARLYPCGECAAEFQMLLKKFPPQVRIFSTTVPH
jgi:hypothetical protein